MYIYINLKCLLEGKLKLVSWEKVCLELYASSKMNGPSVSVFDRPAPQSEI